ncbi:MAG: PAS domain S-box protein [Myxococcales bacterium]|nr:PAS domain S-box protein [Myxococcales bacterium]
MHASGDDSDVEALLLALGGGDVGAWSWDRQSGRTTGLSDLAPILARGQAFGQPGDLPFEALLGDDERLAHRLRMVGLERDRATFSSEVGALIGGRRRVLRIRGRGRWSGDGELLDVRGTIEIIGDQEAAPRPWDHAFFCARLPLIVGNADFQRVEMVNGAFAESHGYTIDELLALPPRELFAPEVRAALPAEITEAHRRGHYSFESVHVRKDGTRFPVIVDVTTLKDASGVVLHRIAAVQDISDRKAAEERLRRSEEALRQIFEASPISITLYSSEGRVLQANPAALKLFGVDGIDGLRGINLFERVALRAEQRARIAAGEGVYLESTIDFDELRAGGLASTRRGKADVVLVITPLVGGDILVQKLDVTDQREAERAAARLQAELEQSHKMEAIGRLAGGVVHDFNNILAVISMRAELALDALRPNDPASRPVRGIIERARHSSDLVRRLLSFARREEVTPKIIELGGAVEGMLEMLRQLLGEEIGLSFARRGEPWRVLADPGQLDQILVNLCVNARDAMAGRGRIDVRVESVRRPDPRASGAPADYVRLSVHDDGPGIAPADLRRIFEPFSTTKSAKKGVGLGLATVYGIVQQCRGVITVESSLGSGTTFRVDLPRHVGEEEGAGAGEEVAAAPPRARAGERVLVVEDDPEVLASERDALLKLGYEVVAARGAAEAIEIVDELGPSIALLVSDVIMPELRGPALAAAIRERLPELRVLLISGDVDGVDLEGPGDEVLDKPFTFDALASAVRRALDRPPPG